eukprot:97609_1
MGQLCLSFKDHHGNILGYTLHTLNDMSQGTGYERLMWRDMTPLCLEELEDNPWWDGTYNDVSSRYYWTQFEYMWVMWDGWCKSDPDAFFIEELYQFTDIIKHMPSSGDCWVQGT